MKLKENQLAAAVKSTLPDNVQNAVHLLYGTPKLTSKKKIIVVLSDAGNIGKTLMTSAILETLRLLGITVEAYTCDSRYQSLYHRYGERTQDGNLIPIDKQNPKIGVGFIDISNPHKKIDFVNSFNTDSMYFLYDMPSNSKEALATAFEDIENLLSVIEEIGAELIIVAPIKDSKSEESFHAISQEFLQARLVVAINAGYIKATEKPEDAEKEIARLVDTYQVYPQINIEHKLSPEVFSLLKTRTLREVYTPRIERTNSDGSITGEGTFPANKLTDTTVLNKFIPAITRKIKEEIIDKWFNSKREPLNN